jgi:hypothetical protein
VAITRRPRCGLSALFFSCFDRPAVSVRGAQSRSRTSIDELVDGLLNQDPRVHGPCKAMLIQRMEEDGINDIVEFMKQKKVKRVSQPSASVPMAVPALNSNR